LTPAGGPRERKLNSTLRPLGPGLAEPLARRWSLAKVSHRPRERPGPAAFPAGPRGGLVCPEGKSSKPAAREIGAKESRATVCSRPVHTHAISRVAAENASGPGLTVRVLSGCEPRRRVHLPLTAMSEEHGREELEPRLFCDECSSDGPVGNLGGRAGACRRGRRPDAGAAPLPTPSPLAATCVTGFRETL